MWQSESKLEIGLVEVCNTIPVSKQYLPWPKKLIAEKSFQKTQKSTSSKRLRQPRAAGAQARGLSSMHTPVVWLAAVSIFLAWVVFSSCTQNF